MSKVKIILKSAMPLHVLFGALAIALIPGMAQAAWPTVSASSTPGDILCAIAGYASGSLASGVATLAVVSLGVAAAFGRASWTQGIIILIGCTIALGAGSALASIGLPYC